MLFGFFGVLFGIPLAVVVMCLVRNLYVENGLEKGAPERAKALTRTRHADDTAKA
jgi:predicted PurR-regulated permease PerM